MLALALILAAAVGDSTVHRPVVIHFDGRVGSEVFRCGTRYAGIGARGTTIAASDFRFYVSDVTLLTDDGRELPVTLDDDGRWQRDGAALIDFEDGTGACANGTTATRSEIRGMAEAARYTGVRFTLGLPFALNHRDLSKQGSPFDVTSLFWSWRGGYKFLRLDLAVESPVERLFLHLGSTGCTPSDGPPTAAPIQCAQRNTVRVQLDGFDPGADLIVADVAALLAGADLTVNQPKTAKGCMSAPDDADCAPIFANLGLPFADHAPGSQRFFRVESAAR